MMAAAMGWDQPLARRDGSFGHEIRMSRRQGSGCPKEKQQSTVTQMTTGVPRGRRWDQVVVSRRNRAEQQQQWGQQAQHVAVYQAETQEQYREPAQQVNPPPMKQLHNTATQQHQHDPMQQRQQKFRQLRAILQRLRFPRQRHQARGRCGCPKEKLQSALTQMAAGVTVGQRWDQGMVSRRSRVTSE